MRPRAALLAGVLAVLAAPALAAPPGIVITPPSGGAGTITGVTAGSGLSGGGTSGNVTVTAKSASVSGAVASNGSGTYSQATCASLSGAAASCATDTTNAANIGSGTLPAARLPALSGDVSSSAGSASLTVSKTNGHAFTATAYTAGAAMEATPATPAGPASTSFTMAGMGASCSFTPHRSGTVILAFNGAIHVLGPASNLDGIALQIAYGTGTAPANGAAAAGTVAGATSGMRVATTVSSGAEVRQSWTPTAVVTGLTVGATYWFDVQQEATDGNFTASIFDASCSAFEE